MIDARREAHGTRPHEWLQCTEDGVVWRQPPAAPSPGSAEWGERRGILDAAQAWRRRVEALHDVHNTNTRRRKRSR